jgi:arsenate reductase (thioredoxin)
MQAAGKMLNDLPKLRVLFLCTGNACRSQMAEGWARVLKGSEIEPFSAGIIAAGLDPLAVAAMAEAEVDISTQHSKSVDELRYAATGALPQYEYVVTLCGNAHETCPAFPGPARIMHAGFDDPPSLARGAATREAALLHYRRVRDEIREFIARLPGALKMENHETRTSGEAEQ